MFAKYAIRWNRIAFVHLEAYTIHNYRRTCQRHQSWPRVFRITSRMDLKQVMCVDVGWIHLAQKRDQRRVVLNTVMNLGFHITGGISRRTEWLSASQWRICVRNSWKCLTSSCQSSALKHIILYPFSEFSFKRRLFFKRKENISAFKSDDLYRHITRIRAPSTTPSIKYGEFYFGRFLCSFIFIVLSTPWISECFLYTNVFKPIYCMNILLLTIVSECHHVGRCLLCVWMYPFVTIIP
jgi:hypothetical protein